MDSRREKFRRVLAAPTVDLDALRELAWNGIPADIRPAVWRLLLGYAPPNQDRQEEGLRRKREQYAGWVTQYFEENAEENILKQIGLDVPRTSPGVPFFHRPELQRSLTRILYIRAIRNPASGYVQGINDLVTPFLRVFLSEVCDGDMESWDVDSLPSEALGQVEADCYWCLAKMLDTIQDHYTFAQPGIQLSVYKLSELVRRIDEKIYNHLLDNNLEFLQFSFRWFNCLLLREFPFLLVDRLWDTYISEGNNFADFLVYACAAFLLTWSSKLLNMEFQDMIMFLQSPPTEHWTYDQVDTVMSKAFLWRAVFSRAQSHLK